MKPINISKLENIDDIYELVRNDFSKIKEELNTSSDEVFISFNDIGMGMINISALTMLTCVLNAIRRKYEYPFIGFLESHQDEHFYADPKKASFLKAINFIGITQELRIIDWQISKSIPDLDFNPNTGIMLIDVPEISPTVQNYYDSKDYFNKDVFLYHIIKQKTANDKELEIMYEDAKTEIKNDIKSYIFDDISKVFTDKEGRSLKNNVISYASEIILNSFIHGRVNPFLAVQRTGKKISVTICDDGIGLVDSFEKLHNEKISKKDALVKACKHRVNDSYGIYDVLISVLGIDKPTFVMNDSHHGFVTISDDSYILTITRNNIKKLINKPDEIKPHNKKQPIRGVRVALDILIK